MSDREVYFEGHLMVHGKGVKDSENDSNSTDICFDGVVNTGSQFTGGTLEIDKLVYDTREEYEWLAAKLKELKTVKGNITTREVIRMQGQDPYVIVKNFVGCIRDGKDYEMKPEEASALNIKFKWESCDEYTDDYIA